MRKTPSDVTRLLRRWTDGDRQALDELIHLLHEHLRVTARERLRFDPASASLNTATLVRDAYFDLVDLRSARFRDRAHFLAIGSRVMRRLLTDHVRASRAARRGGGAVGTLGPKDAFEMSDAQIDMIAELDDVLQRLEAVDARQSAILEQRFFGGLSPEETAEAVGISVATVSRELRFARAWLAAELRQELVS
jgi:RNA polymerase sigma factor (TIGR02999 family)